MYSRLKIKRFIETRMWSKFQTVHPNVMKIVTILSPPSPEFQGILVEMNWRNKYKLFRFVNNHVFIIYLLCTLVMQVPIDVNSSLGTGDLG